MSATTPEELLGALPVFAALGREELADLARVAQPFCRLPGERLFRQGDPADSLYVVESGRLEAVTHLPAERELALATIERGEVIGELALVSGGSRSATVRAVVPTAGFVIERHAFDSLRGSLSPGAVAVMRRLCGVVGERLRRRYAVVGDGLGEDEEEARGSLPSRRAEFDPVTETDRLFASRLPFFGAFPPGDLGRLLSEFGRVELARGDRLVCAGDRLDAFYLTLRGAVEATIQRGERKQRVRLAGPGTACAYLGLIDDGPGLIGCRARERALVLALPRVRFHELVSGDGLIARRFLDAVLRDLVDALRVAQRPQATLIAAKPVPSTRPGDYLRAGS